MPITVLSDIIMPNSVISSGVRGKNLRMNSRVPVDNGFESINIIWSQTLREYEIGTVPMFVAQWQAVEGLHEITDGGAYGFLMEDPKDNTVTTEGVMSEISSGIYQLKKRYMTSGSTRFKDRTITRPKVAGFVPTNSGTPIGSYTLDEDTGQITIPGAPSASLLGWSGRFYVPVHFKEDSIDWDLIGPGASQNRLLAGPSVVLVEVRE